MSAREQGVPVWRIPKEVSVNREELFGLIFPHCLHDWQIPGRWFPEPVASRLIDPDDPEVRERIGEAVLNSVVRNWKSVDDITDAILDALRGGDS